MRPQNLPQQDVPEAEAALRDTVTMILAGGQGERLYPLTRDRAKPAVPFAGDFRLIDFTLSNLSHSEIFYRGAVPMAILFGGIFLLGRYQKRFWCRNLCPLGALLSLVPGLAGYGH
mgnify:CR=1 FL=1